MTVGCIVSYRSQRSKRKPGTLQADTVRITSEAESRDPCSPKHQASSSSPNSSSSSPPPRYGGRYNNNSSNNSNNKFSSSSSRSAQRQVTFTGVVQSWKVSFGFIVFEDRTDERRVATATPSAAERSSQLEQVRSQRQFFFHRAAVRTSEMDMIKPGVPVTFAVQPDKKMPDKLAACSVAVDHTAQGGEGGGKTKGGAQYHADPCPFNDDTSDQEEAKDFMRKLQRSVRMDRERELAEAIVENKRADAHFRILCRMLAADGTEIHRGLLEIFASKPFWYESSETELSLQQLERLHQILLRHFHPHACAVFDYEKTLTALRDRQLGPHFMQTMASIVRHNSTRLLCERLGADTCRIIVQECTDLFRHDAVLREIRPEERRRLLLRIPGEIKTHLEQRKPDEEAKQLQQQQQKQAVARTAQQDVSFEPTFRTARVHPELADLPAQLNEGDECIVVLCSMRTLLSASRDCERNGCVPVEGYMRVTTQAAPHETLLASGFIFKPNADSGEQPFPCKKQNMSVLEMRVKNTHGLDPYNDTTFCNARGTPRADYHAILNGDAKALGRVVINVVETVQHLKSRGNSTTLFLTTADWLDEVKQALSWIQHHNPWLQNKINVMCLHDWAGVSRPGEEKVRVEKLACPEERCQWHPTKYLEGSTDFMFTHNHMRGMLNKQCCRQQVSSLQRTLIELRRPVLFEAWYAQTSAMRSDLAQWIFSLMFSSEGAHLEVKAYRLLQPASNDGKSIKEQLEENSTATTLTVEGDLIEELFCCNADLSTASFQVLQVVGCTAKHARHIASFFSDTKSKLFNHDRLCCLRVVVGGASAGAEVARSCPKYLHAIEFRPLRGLLLETEDYDTIVSVPAQHKLSVKRFIVDSETPLCAEVPNVLGMTRTNPNVEFTSQASEERTKVAASLLEEFAMERFAPSYFDGELPPIVPFCEVKWDSMFGLPAPGGIVRCEFRDLHKHSITMRDMYDPKEDGKEPHEPLDKCCGSEVAVRAVAVQLGVLYVSAKGKDGTTPLFASEEATKEAEKRSSAWRISLSDEVFLRYVTANSDDQHDELMLCAEILEVATFLHMPALQRLLHSHLVRLWKKELTPRRETYRKERSEKKDGE